MMSTYDCRIPRPPAGASLKQSDSKCRWHTSSMHSPATRRGLIEAIFHPDDANIYQSIPRPPAGASLKHPDDANIYQKHDPAFPGHPPGPH